MSFTRIDKKESTWHSKRTVRLVDIGGIEGKNGCKTHA